MNGTFSDACGVVVATLLGIPLVVLPGYALGRLTGILGFRALAPGDRLLCGALLGIGLLPYTAVAEELADGQLASPRVLDADPVRRQIVAIRRRDAGPPSGIVAALLDTIADVSDDLQRAPTV